MRLSATLGAVAAMAVAGGGYALGVRAGRAAEASIAWRAEAQAAREAVARMERSAAASANTSRALAEAAARTRIQTVTLVREIPKLVTPEIDARYPLPAGLVRVHDAAALGLDVSAVLGSGGADDAPAGAQASDLAAVVAQNYGACLEDQKRLASWQAWARDQAEALR